MNPSADSSNVFSGFAIALGLIIYSALWLAAPSNYFLVSATSDAALGSYIVAFVILAIGIVGICFELANKEISAFLKRLVTGNLPRGIWGSPSAATWESLGITVGLLLLTSVIHLVGIELFDATGIASGIVKVVVMLSLSLVILGFASTLDELAVKPLLLTPARRLVEGGASAQPQSGTQQTENTVELRESGGSVHRIKRVGAGFIVVSEIVSAALIFWQITTRILESIG